MKPMKINTNSIFKTALSLAAVVLFGTNASAQCDPPGTPVISEIESTSIRATWTAAPDNATGVQYEWEVRLNDASTPGSGNEIETGFTVNGLYTTGVQGLEFATSYVFYVRYICNDDPFSASDWIASAPFSTLTLQAPEATPPTSVTGISFRANWISEPGADSYLFDLSTESDFSTFVGIYENLSVTNNFIDITGLTPNTVYYYRVRAVGNNGTQVISAYSNVIERETTGPATSVYTWVENPEEAGTGTWAPADGIPDETKDVIIDYDYNTAINASFVGKSLTINAGRTLTIADGTYVDIRSNVTNLNADNEGLIVQSGGNLNQTFTGVNTNFGGMKVERLSAEIYRLDYTIWSSPASGKPGEVGSQTLREFSPATLPNRFYTYGTLTDDFVEVDPFTTEFAPGNGYLIRMANNHPDYEVGQPGTSWLGTFEGPINGGTYTVPMDLSGAKFNMIGNPYPSKLSLDAFLAVNDDLTGAIYFWRRRNNIAGTGNTQAFYATYTNAGGVGIPVSQPSATSEVPESYANPGQGFIVQGGPLMGNSVTFTNAMREFDPLNIPFFRSNTEKNRFWLDVSYDGSKFNEMLVAYLPTSSNELDRADGLFIGDATIALTSLVNNEEYVIQGRAPFTVTDVVPLHFRASATGNFTIGFDRADGIFNGDQNIYLKDNVTNIVHDIKASDYTFAAVAGVYADRFEIVYTNSLSVGSPVFDANAVVVYKQNGAIQINAGNTIMSDVKVFDIRGRLVAQKNNVNATETSLVAGAENQVLIIQISSENNGVVSKKFIN